MYRNTFECICGYQATVVATVINPANLAFEIEATCSQCGARYYKRDADLPWWAPISRVKEMERVEKEVPTTWQEHDDDKFGEFVKRAADALARAIQQQ